jgi:hypothetical protein
VLDFPYSLFLKPSSVFNGQQTDFHNARRTVNGTDRAGYIAGIAQRLMSTM